MIGAVGLVRLGNVYPKGSGFCPSKPSVVDPKGPLSTFGGIGGNLHFKVSPRGQLEMHHSILSHRTPATFEECLYWFPFTSSPI